MSLRLPGIDAYAKSVDDIDGWFDWQDFKLFDSILAHQLDTGIKGDVLEIGAYRGKSAIVLGYGMRLAETLAICDPFENVGNHPDVRKMAIEEDQEGDYLADFHLSQFTANWDRFHDTRPTIYQCDSAELAVKALPLFRFIHLDGCHNYRCVGADIALAVQHSGDRGVIVIDDWRNFSVPGVAAAAWEARHAGLINPFAVSPEKMYCAIGAVSQRYWAGVVKTWLAPNNRVSRFVSDGLRGDVYEFPDFEIVRIVS